MLENAKLSVCRSIISACWFSIFFVRMSLIHSTASCVCRKFSCPFLIVDIEPYFGLHTLPMGVPALSTNIISISRSTASITASLVMLAPLLICIRLTPSGGMRCFPSCVVITKASLSLFRETPYVFNISSI